MECDGDEARGATQGTPEMNPYPTLPTPHPYPCPYPYQEIPKMNSLAELRMYVAELTPTPKP